MVIKGKRGGFWQDNWGGIIIDILLLIVVLLGYFILSGKLGTIISYIQDILSGLNIN